MKKYILTSTIALLALVSIASAQTYSFTNDLSVGATGSDVANLQSWLISHSFDIPAVSSGAVLKGYFGSQTKAALIRYQVSVSLPPFGYFGPLTRGIVNRGNNNGNSLRVTSPNGGEQWQLGTTHNITWTGARGILNQTGDIRLEYPIPACAQPGQPIRCMILQRAPQVIAYGVNLNSGSYAWNVGQLSHSCDGGVNCPIAVPVPLSDGQYKVQICPTNAASCADSDSYFTVISASSAGPLQVTSPIGGEQWLRGTTQNITWTSPYYIRATYANIILQRQNICTTQMCPMIAYAPYTIASNVSINQNSYSWNVGSWNGYVDVAAGCDPLPANYSGTTNCPRSTPTIPDGQYTIQICEVSSNNCASSKSPFTIYSGTVNNQAPVISGIDAPTTLAVGQTGTWTVHASDPQNSQLSYYVDWSDTPTYPGNAMTSATPQFMQSTSFTHAFTNTGTHTVTVYVRNAAGLNAQLSATVNVTGVANPTITVLSPNGGEYWTRFTTQPLRWSYVNADSNSKVDLYLSQDNGRECGPYVQGIGRPVCDPLPYITLDKNIAANATYNWIVGTDIVNNPTPVGTYYLRVCAAGTNNCSTGSSYFTIQ